MRRGSEARTQHCPNHNLTTTTTTRPMDRSFRASTSTPLRALPSNLASRAAPTVPPATQTYEPLVKSVLRHRLLSRIFAVSAVFTWGIVIVASTWRQGLSNLGVMGVLLNPIYPRTVALALTIWLVSVVPIIVMRKAFLTCT